MIRTLAAALATTTCLVALATPAAAQTREFNIPAGSLRAALDTFARQSGRQVIYRGDEVRKTKSPGVRGARTAEDALEALLASTGFAAKRDSSGAFAVVKVGNASAEIAAANSEGEDIVVTGSQIKGAPPTSPVITINRQDIERGGFNDLGEVARSIPQNFGGGQNPGVLSGASALNLANQNTTGASSLNLRGLGPDASLTLINGQRLSYDNTSQAVDISAIPIAAIERLEIVADGASAIYGSDAVAGVANVILRRDFEGLTTTARLGNATDGGDFQQQYSAVAGHRWNSGGLMVAYEYARETPIFGSQRDYTTYLPDPTPIMPGYHRNAGVISAHQDLGSLVTISADAFINQRKEELATNILTASQDINRNVRTITVAPSVEFHISPKWNVTTSGSYGQDNDWISQYNYTTLGVQSSYGHSCYCNTEKSGDVLVRGSLLSLNGNDVRTAFGGGYRENTSHHYSLTSSVNTYGDQHSTFFFGELAVPVFSASQGVPLVRELFLTGAFRHEQYNDYGAVTTPKVGLVYSPISGVRLKASWGRSYKAPTLAQTLPGQSAVELIPAIYYTSTAPANSTVLYVAGDNPNLKPERATSWTTTMELEPRAISGLHLELSYFRTNYTDRVVQPITNLLNALSDPAYTNFVIRSPTVAQQQAAIALGSTGLINGAGSAYDPSKVIAIFNDSYANVSAQNIHGIDLSFSYRRNLGDYILDLTGSTSYLSSSQRTTPQSSPSTLAGTQYNPPHWRSRGGASLSAGRLVLSGFLNYTGGVSDTVSSPSVDGKSMLTADFTASYSTGPDHALLSNIQLSLAVINIANASPPYLLNRSPLYVPYDSTNYSPVGRYVSVQISKHW